MYYSFNSTYELLDWIDTNLAVDVVIRRDWQGQRIQLPSTLVTSQAFFVIRIILHRNLFSLIDGTSASAKKLPKCSIFAKRVHNLLKRVPGTSFFVAWRNLRGVSIDFWGFRRIDFVLANLTKQLRTMHSYIVRIQFFRAAFTLEAPLVKSVASYKIEQNVSLWAKMNVTLEAFIVLTCGEAFRIVDGFFARRTLFLLHDDSVPRS